MALFRSHVDSREKLTFIKVLLICSKLPLSEQAEQFLAPDGDSEARRCCVILGGGSSVTWGGVTSVMWPEGSFLK